MYSNAANQTKSRKDVTMALTATFVIHASVVAGIIWGGWLNVATGTSPVKPEHRLVTIKLTTKQETIPVENKNQFTPVNPETRSITPPEKKTPFYSNANSIAANTETLKRFKDTPRIKNGDSIAPGTVYSPISTPSATRLIPRPNINPLQRPKLNQISTDTKPHTPSININSLDPASTLKPTTDLATTLHLSKKSSKPAVRSNNKSPLLPNLPDMPKGPTLSEAKAGLGSRSMSQEGGVIKKGGPALDVRLTGFGDYDSRFFAAISIAWRKQIKDRSWTPSRVVVDFNLYHDGKINNLVVRETNAAAVLQYYCREAIQRPAPFEPWTDDMRRQLGKGPRHCRISFNYLVR